MHIFLIFSIYVLVSSRVACFLAETCDKMFHADRFGGISNKPVAARRLTIPVESEPLLTLKFSTWSDFAYSHR